MPVSFPVKSIANPVIRKGNGTITGNVADIGANLCTTAAEAMLNCHILNNVVATRTWRKNGVILPETGETLTITPPVDTNDMYTCTVQNMCAMDSASTTVFSKRERERRGERKSVIYRIINI